jgi:hypothetical protein
MKTTFLVMQGSPPSDVWRVEYIRGRLGNLSQRDEEAAFGRRAGKMPALPARRFATKRDGNEDVADFVPHGRLRLEFRSWHAALADDGAQCADRQLGMIRDGDGPGSFRRETLHDDMAPSPAHLGEAVSTKYATDVAP